jgi:hypothetical protein
LKAASVNPNCHRLWKRELLTGRSIYLSVGVTDGTVMIADTCDLELIVMHDMPVIERGYIGRKTGRRSRTEETFATKHLLRPLSEQIRMQDGLIDHVQERKWQIARQTREQNCPSPTQSVYRSLPVQKFTGLFIVLLIESFIASFFLLFCELQFHRCLYEHFMQTSRVP